MTELAENPQDSFDPCLDAPVFGAVNLGGRHERHQGLCAYRDDDPNRCWRCHVSRAPEDDVCPKCKAAERDRPHR